MKALKKTFIITIAVTTILIFPFSSSYHNNSVDAISNPPRVGVLLFNASDSNIANIKQGLEDIQKENPATVKFSFYGAKDNQAIQNTDIDNLIKDNVDLLLVNLVDTKKALFKIL